MAFHVISHNTTMTFAGKAVRAIAVVATLSVVCASVMCTAITYAELTEDQKTNTRAFLNAFTPYSTDLQNTWTTAGDDFCSWKYVNCNSPYGVLFNVRQTSFLEGKLTQLPELPAYADGSHVIVNTIMLAVESTAGLGTLPESWGRLSSLSAMSLDGNGITGSLPASWSSLPSISTISLQVNQLTGTLPASWGSLSTLSYLFLNGNQLTGTLPASWSSLSRIVSLYLTENQLTGSIPEEWSQMTQLTYGDFTSNDLCGCLPSAWAGNDAIKVDAPVKASDCATAKVCTASSSSSSSTHLSSFSSGSSSQPLPSFSSSASSSSIRTQTSSSSSKTSSHAVAECAVSYCITCEKDNINQCAECEESYELTGNLQCAQKESNGAVRVSWNAGCQWVTFAIITLASAALFLF